VFLQPIAAPSILGLFGFAMATMMVGAWQAGWYGNAATPLILFPLALVAGGLAQFVATVWSYRARDGLATAMHGVWGSFWLAFGLLFLLVAVGAFPLALTPALGVVNQGFAFWFVVLCLITAIGAFAALGENLGLAGTLTALALGAAFNAAGFFSGTVWPLRVAGWLFVVSALIAIYTAAAMLLEGSYGRSMLPLGRRRHEADIPGRGNRSLEYTYGQPGVKIGQ
jgi:succinate-acetate transporter protein